MPTNPIRISTPTDVLDAVPALLGYYPTDSLVGLFLEHTHRGFTYTKGARMSVPTNEVETAVLLATVDSQLNRHAAVILVLYTADQDEARTVMRLILGHIDTDKVPLAILATVNGWTTIDPDRPDVIQWTNPYPGVTGTVAAQLADAGHYPAGTRADITDSIQAPDPATSADYALGRSLDPVPDDPTADQLRQMADEVRRWISDYLRRPTTIIPEEAAYIAARIRHSGPRDELLDLLDLSTAPQLAAMWRAVAGMTPDTDALPVLGCLAVSAWVAGDGTLANIAAERAHQLPEGPGARLMRLVESLLHRAVPPTIWDDMKRQL